MATGGIGHAWNQAGRSHFGIREIDYAEVLRERAGGYRAEWDRIVEFCLQGQSGVLDDTALAALLQAVGDTDTFGSLLEHFERFQAMSGVGVDARAAALLQLMRNAVDAVRKVRPEEGDHAMQTMADACGRLTPDMMTALLDARQSTNAADATLASAAIDRMSDRSVASFVARAVASERGATEEMARAFDALVPQADMRDRVLDMARDEARLSELGADPGFEELWQSATETLKAGSGPLFLLDAEFRELTKERDHALEVERISDDPPDRVQAWIDSVSDSAIQHLDSALLRDLLRIEFDPDAWEPMAMIVVEEIERRVLQSDSGGARELVEVLVGEMASKNRPPLRHAATRVLERLSTGPLVRHVLLQLRKDEAQVEDLSRLCHTVGAGLARPFAELLAVEDNPRATRRLRELLLGFGAAGRQAVEQLKHSLNPAVRRTAIDLLRGFGGQEALAELATMLDDPDPEVQRESIRAIVQIGTNNAYAVLQRALMSESASRDTVTNELLAWRDDKAVPLLCYVLRQTEPNGKLYRVHMEMIETIGTLKPFAESVRTLRHVLYRGSWWTPFRTAALRHRAALALRRLGSPEAIAVLEEAVAGKLRGPRKAARAQLAQLVRTEPAKGLRP